MRNINELIGIIRAVDFDDVINQQEIERLRSWVSYNRNLAFEQEHISLLKLVEDVIEDNIITEEEKTLLFDLCEKIQKCAIDESLKLFELNGIIEGIVCDGNVNEAEIRRVKQWMEINDEFIRSHKFSIELREMLDNVLADGIVTEDEQSILIKILSEHISRSQFDMKLNYLKKKVRAGKIIGTDLIDLLDDENALDEIHTQAESFIISMMGRYTKSTMDSEIVYISLILIGMVYYDGNFYDNVRTTYKKLYSLYPQQSVEIYIRSILKRNKPHSGVGCNTSRYINIALHNAIVPANYLKSFFDFIYDIYRLNFEYVLPENLYEEFDFVYKGLRDSMLSEGDDLQIQATKKTYKLIKTTKELIVDKDAVESVIHLSMIIVKLIDKHVWNKSLIIYNPYLKNAFAEWSKQYDLENNEESKHKKMSSHWQPRFILSDNEVCLFPPVHKVRTDHYYDLSIAVYNDDVEIHRITNPYIEEILGGYKIKPDIIKINKPLGTLTYKLLQGKSVVYDSKDKLYRGYIMFDSKGEEIKNNTEYQGTVILASSKLIDGFKSYINYGEYNLSSRNVLVGDYYVIDEDVFNFSALFKPGVFGDYYENCNLFDVLEENKISVLKRVKYVMFESDKKNAEYYITIDNNKQKLSDFEYTEAVRAGVTKYIVSVRINEPGVHKVLVEQSVDGIKRRILYMDFLLDTSLETNCARLDDDAYIITLKTDLSDTVISKEIYAKDFDPDGIEINYRNKKYKYGIPFAFDFYRITGQPWKPLQKGIWIDDVNQDSVLEICGNNIESYMVYPYGQPQLLDLPKIKHKGTVQQIPINYLVSYKTSCDYTLLVFVIDGRVQKALFCDNRCNLNVNETILDYDSTKKTLTVVPKYNGKGNVFVQLSDEKGNEIIRSGIIDNSSKVVFTEIESLRKYRVGFFEKAKGLVLGSKERLMHEYEKMYCAEDDLINKKFKVLEIKCLKHNKNEEKIISADVQQIYVRFTNMMSNGTYLGDIREGKSMLITSLRNVNPVEIKVCSEPYDEVLDIIVSHNGKQLRYNDKSNRIYNGIIKDLPEIISLKLSLSEENY